MKKKPIVDLSLAGEDYEDIVYLLGKTQECIDNLEGHRATDPEIISGYLDTVLECSGYLEDVLCLLDEAQVV